MPSDLNEAEKEMDTPTPEISMKKYDTVILRGLTLGLAVLGAGALYGVYLLMPLLVELAKDTVIFFGLMFVAAFLVLGAFQLFLARGAVYMKMKMVAQNLRRAYIKRDPIAAIDVAIHNLQAKLDEADERAIDADAAMKTLAKQIRNPGRTGAADKADEEETLARVAGTRGRPEAEVNLHLVNAERWRRTVATLDPMLENQRTRQAKINQARELAANGIANLRNQRETKSIELAAFKAEAAQAKSFRSMFGQNEDQEAFDIAIDEIERTGAQCEAEVEAMLRQAEPGIQRAQLQADADAARAKERINAAAAPKAIAAPVTNAAGGSVKDGVVVSGGQN